MIDILRGVAAHTAVDAPIPVKTTDIDAVLPSDPPDDFVARYALADVLANLVPFAESDRRDASLAVNGRLADSDSRLNLVSRLF
jgi:hypothetical protein